MRFAPAWGRRVDQLTPLSLSEDQCSAPFSVAAPVPSSMKNERFVILQTILKIPQLKEVISLSTC